MNSEIAEKSWNNKNNSRNGEVEESMYHDLMNLVKALSPFKSLPFNMKLGEVLIAVVMKRDIYTNAKSG